MRKKIEAKERKIIAENIKKYPPLEATIKRLLKLEKRKPLNAIAKRNLMEIFYQLSKPRTAQEIEKKYAKWCKKIDSLRAREFRREPKPRKPKRRPRK